MSTTANVRLHISPLTSDTYPIIVPASLHDSVLDLSYHQVPAFPEKNYGYVELPEAEAEKLRKRVNGALVKGAKIKIEEARPKKVVDYGENSPLAAERHQSARVKGDRDVLQGIRLPDSRRVRRAWTDPSMAKVKKTKGSETEKKPRTERSKYTDKEELLFKTKAKVKSDRDSGKKRKRGDDTTTIHEFKQTTKFPTFLREKDGARRESITEYDVEKGWVDQDGNVVEGPRRSRRNHPASPGARRASIATTEVTKAAKKLSIQPKKTPLNVSVEQDDDTSSSGSDSDSGESEDEKDEKGAASNKKAARFKKELSSSPEHSDRGDENPASPESKLTLDTTPKINRTIPSLEIQPDSAASEKADQLHPLEAIFKKSKTNSKKPPGLELKIPSAFSFFGDNGDVESEDGDIPTALPALPQTPFTQADLRFRRERSAAPTPDTAAPTKLFFGSVMDQPVPASAPAEEADDDSNDEKEEDVDKAEEDANGNRSEFADKWFWENRGDNNRAWKKRRREVGKQKRYEGNKRRTRNSAA